MKRVPVTVWCRQAMWQPGAGTAPLTRSDLFDAILEPGEFAAAEDAGPTSARRDEAHQVAPIVFLDDSEVLPRAEAERELGLERGKPAILVQLGQGGEVAAATDRCLRALAARDDVQVAAASSAIAGLLDVPAGIVHMRSAYPMSRPTDDQAARAGYAEGAGVGLAVEGPGDERIEQRLGELLDPDRRGAMREKLHELRPENGAAEAARWMQELAGDPEGSSRPAPRRTARPVRWGSPARAWVFVRTLPQTVTRLVRQTVSLPRPRTVILAFGADQPGVQDALERTSDPPERMLVVTDSLAIGDAWRAGTGVEHIPGPGERQAELAGGDYEAFRRRRLGLILAHRPRFRQAIDVGDVPADLREAVLASPRRRARRLA